MAIERIPITSREQWLAERAKDLTASDIGAVLGVNPYRSPLAVYNEKAGVVGAQGETNIMRRGRWFEPAILEAMREEFPTWDIRRAGVYLRDPEIRLGATPDFVATRPDRNGIGNIQGKIVSKPVFEGWEDGRAPLMYRLQTVAEAMLENASWALLAVLIVDTFTADLKVYNTPRDDAIEEHIRDSTIQFWKNLREGRAPAPDYRKDEILEEARDETIDLSRDNRVRELLEERVILKDQIKIAENDVDAIDRELKHKMGGAIKGTVDTDWTITYKPFDRKEYVVKAQTIRPLKVYDKRGK